ncbi:hypothetical protein Sjap_024882 [Stephania japonica]|uniref:pyridoxal kinase n=1 Tax=Stephania japonica TaxID=461633 RepID=A0AAP0EE60_9MAGN
MGADRTECSRGKEPCLGDFYVHTLDLFDFPFAASNLQQRSLSRFDDDEELENSFNGAAADSLSRSPVRDWPSSQHSIAHSSGYIGSVSFLDTVLQVVDKLRTINPNLIYVCDPVMGDEGKLYVPPELVAVYHEKVVPVASMLTPNQFEAEQLTGLRIATERDGLEACNMLHASGPSKVVITSVHIGDNLLLIGSHQKVKGQPPEQFKIVIPKIPAYFTGTGDLMTALLLGWSNKYPDHLDRASELAVSTLQALLHRTLSDYEKVGFDPKSSSLEIRLIQSQDDIRNPKVNYKAERYN